MSACGGGRAHLPIRPLWRCRNCAGKWPCGPARLALLAEFGTHRLALRLYLAAQYADALRDLPGVPAGELYDRFVGWPATLRPRSRAIA